MLLATLSDNVVVSKQTGKVRDKERTWDSVKKSLLGNINGFLEELKVQLKVSLQRLYSIHHFPPAENWGWVYSYHAWP